jgi:PAS domain S-box-containing protein
MKIEEIGESQSRPTAGGLTQQAVKVCLAVVLAFNGAVCASAIEPDPSKPLFSRFVRHVWTTEHGLPQNSVTAIVQTHDGYLWLGTFGGLARFDGIRFTVFDTGSTEGLPSNRLLALYEDRQRTLWIGTESNGLVRYAQGTFTAYTTKDGLPSDEITSICEDQEGHLWVGTHRGLAQFAAVRFTTYSTQQGLPNDHVLALATDRDGALWVGTQAGLGRFSHGTFTTYRGPDGLPHDWVSALHVSGDGSLWIGTDTAGLVRFHHGRFTAYAVNPERLGRVMTIGEDREGTIWAGTSRGQLARWRDGQLSIETIDEGVRSLLGDREGNLWIGADRTGLHRWKKGAAITYTTEDGLPDDVILPITDDGHGGLWIGATCGGLVRFHHGSFTTYTSDDGLPKACIWSLLHDRTGNLWIGTWGGGLVQLRMADGGWRIDEEPPIRIPPSAFRHRLVVYTLAQGLSDTAVFALYQDRDGQVWIGTGRGLNRFNNGTFVAYTTKDGLVHNNVRFITQDRTGALWIGTLGGLSWFKDGRFKNYTTRQGLSHNAVRAIHEDAEGTLWIGTYGGGLNRFKDGRFTRYTTRNGLPENIVSRILEDEHGNLWMSGNNGIHRVSRKALNDFAEGRTAFFQAISYSVADGMKTNEGNGGGQPAGWRTDDGRLWFPTVKGLVVIDPRQTNPLAPPVVIERVEVDKRTLDPRGDREAPPGIGNLEIRYTALSLTAPEKVRFKYKLEGYDAQWIEAGAHRGATYTKVPPGRYRFRVMACNNDGLWNETGAAVEFALRPHFYQTNWFYALIAVALVLLGRGLHLLRVRRLEQRNRELETKVAERTTEVQEQQNLLTQAYDELTELNLQIGAANQNLLTIFNQWRSGVMTTDQDGRVTFLSHTAERLFGQPADDAAGQLWEQIVPLPEPDKAQLRALAAHPPDQRNKYMAHIHSASGQRYWVEIEVQDDPRDARRKIFFLYDVTEVYDLRRLLDEKAKFHDLVGESAAMQLVYRKIQDVAQVETTVLIEGETGTGKELVARAIHYAGPRKSKPFIAVNCAGLTETLVTSQLFGHKRGAFTGAVADQVGVFEAANEGTLFLDEIGDMPLTVQTTLLRVLQEKEITRLGESTPRKINVRVIAATHRDLEQEVAAGRFRQDLLYRIRVSRIQLLPLRQRSEDIPLLAAWFLGQCRATEGASLEVSQQVMQAFMNYSWPGNVRELKSAIESAVINCKGPVIQMDDLPPELRGLTLSAHPSDEPHQAEKQRLLEALEQTGGNRAAAARVLGISRSTLYLWMEKLDIK